MTKRPSIVAGAFVMTATILASGYASFGAITTLVFAAGYLGGFVLWTLMPAAASFASIRSPFWLTLGLFLVHRVEEKVLRFQEVLSGITGVPVPRVASFPLIMLLLLGVVPWLLVPLLVRRGYEVGFYFAWTFFAAMGITELAHFVVFPFLVEGQYRYFPGMASVVLLAPAAWWGMWRLSQSKDRSHSTRTHAAAPGRSYT